MKKIFVALILMIAFTISIVAVPRYELPCKAKLLEASRDSAISQIGLLEKSGRNDGEHIDKYRMSVGLKKGGDSPYCAAGQYWCFYSACLDLKYLLSEIPIYKTGSVSKIYYYASRDRPKSSQKPQVNDLICWRQKDSWKGHIERILTVEKAGWVITIGFNTMSGDIGNQRNGGGNFLKKRNLYHFLGNMAIKGIIGFKAI